MLLREDVIELLVAVAQSLYEPILDVRRECKLCIPKWRIFRKTTAQSAGDYLLRSEGCDTDLRRAGERARYC